MLDTIPLGSLLDGFGTVSVIVLVGFLIFTGRLVTRRELVTRIHDKDETIRLWTKAAEVSADQTKKVLENQELQVRIWDQLKRIADERTGP